MTSSLPEALKVVESAALILDPWQRTILEVILSERADGKWECREVGYLVSRQNGKGGVLEALALIGLFLLDDVDEILFSAHEFKTAKKAYRQIRDRIKSAPHLLAEVERRGSRVVGFRHSNEDTSITLTDGTCLRFMARSNNTARGFSPQMLIIDEAQECSEETRQALRYTIRAQANPLIVWTGTVPHPTKNNSEAWTAIRDRGRRGDDRTLGWLEWSPDGSDDPDYPDPDLTDEDVFWRLIEESNPALGYRISEETVDADRESATTSEAIAGLLRECLSIWRSSPADGGDPWPSIARAAWESTERRIEGRGMDPVTVALEVSADFKSAALGAAGPGSEGEVVAVLAVFPPADLRGLPPAERDLTGWLVARCTDAQEVAGRPIVIDEDSPADKLSGTLEAAGVTFTRAKTAQVTTAASDLFIGVTEGRVLHRDDPDQAPLTKAAANVVQKTYGDVWLWDRRTGAVVLPFLAASLALWGSRQDTEEVAVAAVWT